MKTHKVPFFLRTTSVCAPRLWRMYLLSGHRTLLTGGPIYIFFLVPSTQRTVVAAPSQPVDASAPLTYLVFYTRKHQIHTCVCTCVCTCTCVCLIRQQKDNNQECFLSFAAAVAAVSDIADQANDSLKDGVSVVVWPGLDPRGY